MFPFTRILTSSCVAQVFAYENPVNVKNKVIIINNFGNFMDFDPPFVVKKIYYHYIIDSENILFNVIFVFLIILRKEDFKNIRLLCF